MSDRAHGLSVVGVALVLLFGPFIVLALMAPAGATFTGVAYYPGDSFWYLGTLLHAHQGEWLYRDYLTFLPVTPRLIGPVWFALGRLLLAPGPEPQALTYQAIRLVAFVLFCWQAWRLMAEVVPGRATRRLGFAFVLLTSGFGPYIAMLGAHPAHGIFDLDLAESSTFFTLFFPGGTIVLVLMVMYLRALLRTGSRRPSWPAWPSGALAILALSTLHLEQVGVLGLATLLYLLWLGLAGRRSARELTTAAVLCALMLAASLPYTGYTLTAINPDPVFAALLRRSHLHPPVLDPLFYLLGFGIPGLLALSELPGFVRRLGRAGEGEALMWAMAAAGLVLLVAPGSLLDHRGEGLQLVIAPLAARGLLRQALPRLRRLLAPDSRERWRRLRRSAVNTALILSAPTVLYLSLSTVALGGSQRSELYVSASDRAALTWLREHATRDQVAAGGPESDEFMAAYGGIHVAWGSYAWTPDYDAEGVRLIAFLKGDLAPRAYLVQRHVDYLYWGPREASVAAIDPRAFVFLRPVFSSGPTVVYRVVPCEPQCAIALLAPLVRTG